MRLIDADALLKDETTEILEYFDRYCKFGYSRRQIEEAPTIDAVEVVRCKDCEHRDAENGFCKGRGWPMQLVPDDGFCDKGERRRG